MSSDIPDISSVDFLFAGAAEEVDDLTLSQVCEVMENENLSVEGLHDLYLSDEAENATLSQICETIEHSGFDGMEDLTVFEAVNYYDLGTFHLGYDHDAIQKSESMDTGEIAEFAAKDDTVSRFAEPVTDRYIEELINNNENKNTKKNTNWALGAFQKWRIHRNSNNGTQIPELRCMNAEDLNFYMGRFVLEARKQDGTEYPPRSLYYIVCGLLRHLRDCNVHDKNFLDTKDFRFAEFRKLLDCRMKDLLNRGFGTKIKKAEPVLPEDESLIWEKEVFGDRNAEILQFTMFFYNCKLFGLRAHDEHHDLECDQFYIGEDKQGKFVEFVGRSSKTYKGGIAQMELDNKTIKHYCQSGETERCIADFYSKYITALGGKGKFYRRPLSGNGDLLKYGSQPIGVNKLKNMMKAIAEKSGLKGNFTNHSGKRTCATQLYLAGIDEQEIMKRTGHRSEKGVRQYKESSNDIKKTVSSVLNPPVPLKRKLVEDSENRPLKKKVEDCDTKNDPMIQTELSENSGEKNETASQDDTRDSSIPFMDLTNRAVFSNCKISFQF